MLAKIQAILLDVFQTNGSEVRDCVQTAESHFVTEEEGGAFAESKEMLQSADLLVHYDSNKELMLACDMLHRADWEQFCCTRWKMDPSGRLHSCHAP